MSERNQLISQGRHENAKSSSYHSHPQITPLVKNPRANSLQSLITNLQLSTILPAQISSRPLHHPANPLYQIFLHSHSLSTSCHYSSEVLQPSNIQHGTTSLERPTS